MVCHQHGLDVAQTHHDGRGRAHHQRLPDVPAQRRQCGDDVIPVDDAERAVPQALLPEVGLHGAVAGRRCAGVCQQIGTSEGVAEGMEVGSSQQGHGSALAVSNEDDGRVGGLAGGPARGELDELGGDEVCQGGLEGSPEHVVVALYSGGTGWDGQTCCGGNQLMKRGLRQTLEGWTGFAVAVL